MAHARVFYCVSVLRGFNVFIFLFPFRPFQNVEVAEERMDKRSVDDLLSFINGGDGGKYYNTDTLFFSHYVIFLACVCWEVNDL